MGWKTQIFKIFLHGEMNNPDTFKSEAPLLHFVLWRQNSKYILNISESELGMVLQQNFLIPLLKNLKKNCGTEIERGKK